MQLYPVFHTADPALSASIGQAWRWIHTLPSRSIFRAKVPLSLSRILT